MVSERNRISLRSKYAAPNIRSRELGEQLIGFISKAKNREEPLSKHKEDHSSVQDSTEK